MAWEPFVARRACLAAAVVVAGLALGPGVAGAAAAPDVVVEQGTSARPAFPVETIDSAEAFYDYFDGCGHPGFGVVDESHLWVLDGSQGVSLGVLHDRCNVGGTDKLAEFQFDVLPSGHWVVQDDSGDFDTGKNHVEWVWHPGYTDGGMFRGDFRAGVSVTITPSWSGWSPTWQFLSGPDAGTNLGLDRGQKAHLHFCADQPDADLSANLDGAQGANGWWTSDPVNVELSASLPGSCGPLLDGIEYQVDGSGLQAYEGPFDVGGEGVHDLAFHALDAEGDASSPAERTVKVDATPPDVAVENPGDGEVHVAGNEIGSPAGSLPAVVVGQTTVTAGAADATSGVAEVAFLVDGQERAVDGTPPYEWDWAAGDEAAGPHDVTVEARDAAGHAAQDTQVVWTVPTSEDGVSATAGGAP